MHRISLRNDKVKNAHEAASILLASPDEGHRLALLASLWWCEGSKDLRDGVRFTNSDSGTIRFFLGLMRTVFRIDEGRIRLMLHLHEYHDMEAQKAFWAGVAGISQDQLYQPYLKPRTGLRKREGYQGCVTVRYGDVKIARILKAAWDIISIGESGGIVQR